MKPLLTTLCILFISVNAHAYNYYRNHSDQKITEMYSTKDQAVQAGLAIEKQLKTSGFERPWDCDSDYKLKFWTKHITLEEVYKDGQQKFRAIVNYGYSCYEDEDLF